MNDMSSSRGPPATAPASGPPPPVAAPVSSSAASALPVRPAPAVAPLARLEPLGKPTLGPLPALGVSAAKTSDTGMPGSKPQPEPSTGYDDDFEDVEDDTDAAALGDEGDDEDLVAALVRPSSGAGLCSLMELNPYPNSPLLLGLSLFGDRSTVCPLVRAYCSYG